MWRWIVGVAFVLLVAGAGALLSATRIALMMLRVAATPTEIATAPTTADGDYDPLR